MKKILGIAALLVVIALTTTWLSWDASSQSYTFLSGYNLQNLLQRIGMFGVLSIAAAFVIVTGGIDLSIGSVVCVAGCMLPWLLRDHGVPPLLAMPIVLLLCAAIGLWHGLLIVGLGLQPFVVTLCGLLLYRGVMRAFTGDQTMGLGGTADELRWLATGRIPITESFGLPAPLLVLALVAVVTSGRLTVLAYVLCSLLAGLGGCLFVLDVNSAQASSFGNFYELYAIAGAVLGGVALRGGEGMVLGVVLGACLMQLLQNTINLVADSNQLEFAVVGAVILAGAAVDEGVRRFFRRRR